MPSEKVEKLLVVENLRSFSQCFHSRSFGSLGIAVIDQYIWRKATVMSHYIWRFITVNPREPIFFYKMLTKLFVISAIIPVSDIFDMRSH